MAVATAGIVLVEAHELRDVTGDEDGDVPLGERAGALPDDDVAFLRYCRYGVDEPIVVRGEITVPDVGRTHDRGALGKAEHLLHVLPVEIDALIAPATIEVDGNVVV